MRTIGSAIGLFRADVFTGAVGRTFGFFRAGAFMGTAGSNRAPVRVEVESGRRKGRRKAAVKLQTGSGEALVC